MSGLGVKHLPRHGRLGSRMASVRQRPALLVGAAVGMLVAVHLLLPHSPSSPVQHAAALAAQQQLVTGTGLGAVQQQGDLMGGGPLRQVGAATGGSGGRGSGGAATGTTAPAAAVEPAAAAAAAAAVPAAAGGAAAATAATAAAAAAAAATAAAAPAGDWKALAASLPFTIVTGANSGYFRGLNNFVGSLHYWCPKCKLAIYDLGLSEDQLATAKTWCNTTILRFAKPGGLHSYAWKPQVIYDASTRFGMAIWLDAGCTITAPLDKAEAQIRADGVWNIQGQDDDMVRWAHEGTFKYLNQTRDRFHKRPSFAGGLWGFVKGSPHYEHILKPWVACAKTPACIQPPGSSLGNHRFDQSAVSIITYTTADTYNPDGTLMHKRLCPEASPGTEGACPPPLGLRVTPHTDLIAASSSQLKQGGCKGDASERAIWTSRQGCACYVDEATKCANIAGGAQQLPGFAEDTGMVLVD